MTFHNGARFDSGTAKFTLDRARGETSTNPQKQFFQVIDSIETPDAATLVLRLKEPSANLLYWLAWPASVMVEPGSAETNRSQPVGTGPFRFAEWRPGDRVRLERAERYWDEANRPALASAEFRFIADPQAQATAIRSGDVDAIPEFIATELYKSFEGDERLASVVGNTELKVVAGMNARRKPFDDPQVRRALMMAVDRAGLVEAAMNGFGQPIGSHYTPNDPGYRDLTGVAPYDPDAAKALLAEAGYPDGSRPRSACRRCPTRRARPSAAGAARRDRRHRRDRADRVSRRLGRSGAEGPRLRHDDRRPCRTARHRYLRPPELLFRLPERCVQSANHEAERAVDDAARLEHYGRAQEILAQDLPALYLFVMPKLGLWDKRLTGLWTNEPIPSNDLTDVRWTQ